MRTVRYNSLLLLLLTLFLIAGNGLAASLEAKSPQVDIMNSSSSGATVTVTFPEPVIRSKTVAGNHWSTVSMAGTGLIEKAGAPDLPVWSDLYAIPEGAIADVRIVSEQHETRVFDTPVYPHQMLLENPDGEQPKQEFAKQNDLYKANNSIYPRDEVTVSEPMILRDLTLVGVNVNPVRFLPADNSIEITRSITLEINFTGGASPDLSKPVSEAFLPVYQAYVRNWKEFVSEENVTRGTLMIVTPPAFENYLAPLVRWKLQQGFNVHLVNTGTTGTSTSSIHSYIANYYNNIDPNLEYVLLVGDVDGSNSIPTYHHSYLNDEGDRQYGEITGNDYLPEVIIGRYSISGSPSTGIPQLNSIINKQVRYEKNPYNLVGGWLTRAVNVCSFGHAFSIREIMRNITKMMQSKQFTRIDSAYYGPPEQGGIGSAAAVNIIHNAINDGVGFVNYRGWAGSSGWWEPSFGTSELANLQNGKYNGIMTSIVCGTGDYGEDECFGEKWIRMGTPSTPKGGIAFYGASEHNQNVRFANIIDASFYYGSIRQNIHGFGSAVLFSKMAVYEGFPNNRDDDSNYGVEFYFHIYNMLGDPSLQMWVGNPRSVATEFPTTVSTAAASIPVRVFTTLFGNPVSGAHVTLVPANNENTIIKAVTSTRGYATLDVNGLAPGEYVLTITGDNMIPVSQNLTISEDALALSIEDWGIDDSNDGNGDSLWEPGETIEFSPVLENIGELGSDSVTADLTILHPDFTVTTSQVKYAPIDSGASGAPLEPFRIEINDPISDFTSADMRLEISTADTARDYTFLYTRTFNRGMPAFSIESVSYESENSIWQPAEIIDLEVTVKNLGPVDASNVTGTLVSSHDSVSIMEQESSWGNLMAQSEGNNAEHRFRLKASPSIIPGTAVNFTLNINPEDGPVQQLPFSLTVGDVDVTDPVGPDAYGVYIFDNGDAAYSQAPEYDWVEIAPSEGGDGTIVPLEDNGEDSDDNHKIDLPIVFKLYGVFYDQVTINSNGFLGLGSNRWFSQRNWPIPGPLGAEGAMIAGYWDDLFLKSGSQVATYYDEGNSRFIIEYSRMGNILSAFSDLETFEIILYDPSVYPTPTGDGEIVVQYKTVHEAPGTGGRDNASTVGIMNQSHGVGIQYVYAQHYSPGAAQLGTGRAIKFTTNPGSAVAPPDLAEMNQDTLTALLGDTLLTSRPIILKNVGSQNLSFQVATEYDSSLTWLSVEPSNDVIGASGTMPLEFLVEPSELTSAQWYFATLYLTSNAVNYPSVSIPVALYYDPELRLGDTNMDGAVTGEDLSVAESEILSLGNLTKVQQMLTDQDGDGNITIRDIIKIVNIISKNSSSE